MKSQRRSIAAAVLLLVTAGMWLAASPAQAAAGQRCAPTLGMGGGASFQVCVNENASNQFNAVGNMVLQSGQFSTAFIDLVQCRPNHPQLNDCDALPSGCGFVGTEGFIQFTGPGHKFGPTSIVPGSLGHTYAGCATIFAIGTGEEEFSVTPDIAFP
jgi:hypothetical protein